MDNKDESTLASQSQAAQPSINTPEFCALADNWLSAAHSSDTLTREVGAKHAWNAIITYIDSHLAGQSQATKCPTCFGRGYTDAGDPETGATKHDYPCMNCAGTGQSQATRAVPEGWTLVPVEPTTDMQDAPEVAIGGCYSCSPTRPNWGECAEIYKAMIAAAPAAPTAQEVTKSVPCNKPSAQANLMHWALRELLGALPERRDWFNPDAERVLRAVAEAGPGPAQEVTQQAVPSIRAEVVERFADYSKIAHLIGSIFFAGDFKAETANERELETLLIKTGHRYASWGEIESFRADDLPVEFLTQQAAKAETAEQAEGEQANVLPPTRGTDSLLNADELAALRRFNECALDGEGYDVPKEMMQRLAEIGVVRRKSGAYYEHTEYGLAVLDGTHQTDIGELVNSFLGWPLPASLHDDLGRIEKPIGTHLMNADEARAMFEFVLASRFRAQGGNTKADSSDIAPTTSTVSAPEEVRNQALEEAAKLCDEMEEHYAAYKDTAQLNGDIELSIAASGEPRACRFLAEKIRALRTTSGKGEAA